MSKTDLTAALLALGSQPRYPSSINANINVREHRAPTDASIEALQEMTDKVRGQVVQSYVFEGNDLNGAVLVMNMLPWEIMGYQVHIAFKLNGRDYKVTEKVKLGYSLSREEAFAKLVDSIGNAVTALLLREAEGSHEVTRSINETLR